MRGVNYVFDEIRQYEYELNVIDLKNENKIRYTGGSSIGDGLKFNSTLTELNLQVRN